MKAMFSLSYPRLAQIFWTDVVKLSTKSNISGQNRCTKINFGSLSQNLNFLKFTMFVIGHLGCKLHLRGQNLKIRVRGTH